jgi:riboflavin kinase/FMN adenylyltransferase
VRILKSIEELSNLNGPVVIAAGVFDGVHVGHQKVIRTAMQRAAAIEGGQAVVLTFVPNPTMVLNPMYAPRILSHPPHKRTLIQRLGVPNLLEVPFTIEFSKLSPEEFINHLVKACQKLDAIVVGRDWQFGHQQKGNTELLRKLGEQEGFALVDVEPVKVRNEIVSSTRTRKALAACDLPLAEECLGRHYSLVGEVVKGAGIGKDLGFPTANLHVEGELYPGNGVYAVHTVLRGHYLSGIANIGIRPTLEHRGRRILEVHIFDFQDTIYGEDIEVIFLRRLRDEKKFASLGELKQQIEIDVAQARAAIDPES